MTAVQQYMLRVDTDPLEAQTIAKDTAASMHPHIYSLWLGYYLVPAGVKGIY
jgi:hypothetical protein